MFATAGKPNPFGAYVMSRRVLYIEAPAGIAGDMLLGALVDLGLPLDFLQDLASQLDLPGLAVSARRVLKGSLSAVQLDVTCPEGPSPQASVEHEHRHGPQHGAQESEHEHDDHEHVHDKHAHHEHHHHHDERPHEDPRPADDIHLTAWPGSDADKKLADVPNAPHGHRSLAEVLSLLARLGSLEEGPLVRAKRAFMALAVAEAAVHGTTVDQVHFHEVGAADAILDMAGVALGIAELGVDEVYVGALPWGRGFVRAAHGLLPNPAPATVLLLAGHPTFPSEATYEQVTPTGAALVGALAAGTHVPHGFIAERTGLGAGRHPGQGLPNVVRATIGIVPSPVEEPESLWLVETNLDDVSGQVVAHALERVRAAGARDAWHTAVGMKKGRPGTLISVLVEDAVRRAVEDILFAETHTLGVRAVRVERRSLARNFVTVETPWGQVRVKERMGPGGRAGVPEYEDCRELALASGIPLQHILRAAAAAYEASAPDNEGARFP